MVLGQRHLSRKASGLRWQQGAAASRRQGQAKALRQNRVHSEERAGRRWSQGDWLGWELGRSSDYLPHLRIGPKILGTLLKAVQPLHAGVTAA